MTYIFGCAPCGFYANAPVSSLWQVSDQAAVAAFKTASAQDLATALGLPPSRIAVRALGAGSLIVTFAIAPDDRCGVCTVL